jgi:hypothetical protein
VRDRHQVFVAPIARAGQHDDAAAGDVQTLCEISQRGNRVCIVAVIEQLKMFMRPGTWKNVASKVRRP